MLDTSYVGQFLFLNTILISLVFLLFSLQAMSPTIRQWLSEHANYEQLSKGEVSLDVLAKEEKKRKAQSDVMQAMHAKQQAAFEQMAMMMESSDDDDESGDSDSGDSSGDDSGSSNADASDASEREEGEEQEELNRAIAMSLSCGEADVATEADGDVVMNGSVGGSATSVQEEEEEEEEQEEQEEQEDTSETPAPILTPVDHDRITRDIHLKDIETNARITEAIASAGLAANTTKKEKKTSPLDLVSHDHM
jgi:hypothetical protein